MEERQAVQEVEAYPATRAAPRIRVENAAFLALLGLQLWLIFQHSPWLDEEQAFLIAQQPIGAIFGLLHYEGHPALWYLLLKCGTAFTGSPLVLPAAQAVVSAAILGLIWGRSPFPPWMKLLVSLGYFIAFEYGVIARSYGLGVGLFLAFVAWRRTPWAWLFLALLANVAVHTAMLAGICALWLLLEGRWSWRGAGLLAIAGALSLATIWPAPDVVPTMPMRAPWLLRLMEASAWDAALVLPAPLDGEPIHWLWMAPWPGSALLGLAPPALGYLALRRRPWHGLLLLAFFALLFGFGAGVYMTFPRHLGFAAVLFVGLLWAQMEDGIAPNAAAIAWLGLLAAGGVAFVGAALVQPFSPARRVDDWILAQGLERAPWTAWQPHTGLDISERLGTPTFNLVKGCWNTYQRWNYRAGLSPEELARRLNAFADAAGGGYLISSARISNMPNLKALTWFRPGMFEQGAYLYRVTSLHPQVKSLPLCR